MLIACFNSVAPFSSGELVGLRIDNGRPVWNESMIGSRGEAYDWPDMRRVFDEVVHGLEDKLDSPLKLKASVPSQNVVEVSFSATPPGWLERIERLDAPP